MQREQNAAPQAEGGTSQPSQEQQSSSQPAVAAPDAAMAKRLREWGQHYGGRVQEDLDEAAAMIEKLGHGWIPVSERLPESDGVFLCCDGDVVWTETFWYDDGKFFHHFTKEDGHDIRRKVTHWMSLPPPPERP